VKIIRHEKNKGLAAARNTGLDNAIGDYVGAVDSDDYINLKMLEILYEKAVNTDSDIVTCNYLWQFEKYSIKNTIRKRNTKKECLLDILNRTVPPMFCTRLYKRQLLDNNVIRIPEGADVGEDLSIVPRLFYLAQKIDFVDEYLYHYVQFNSLAYTKNYTQKHIDSFKIVFNVLDDFFKDKGDEYLEAIAYNKIITRIMCICAARGIVQEKAYYLFSDIDTRKYLNKFSLLQKVVYILSSRHMFITLNFILDTKYLLGKFKRKLISLGGIKNESNNY